MKGVLLYANSFINVGCALLITSELRIRFADQLICNKTGFVFRKMEKFYQCANSEIAMLSAVISKGDYHLVEVNIV